MREILFRGKRKDNGEWVEGDLMQHYVHHDDLTIVVGGCVYYEVHPETVGQFTGLTDKNGKEIYEGDILSDGKGDNGAVRWIEALGGFCVYVDNTLYSLNEGDPNRSTQLEYTEVIGNIHNI